MADEQNKPNGECFKLAVFVHAATPFTDKVAASIDGLRQLEPLAITGEWLPASR